LSTKRKEPTKRKKEAKKEKRIEIWKTEGVSHIPTRQANHNNYSLSLEMGKPYSGLK
jgi:hypothetical protein